MRYVQFIRLESVHFIGLESVLCSLYRIGECAMVTL